jgi:hypothetical protein
MRTPLDRPRNSIRIDARMDQMRRANVDDLAKRFHQPRAAVLSQIMQWGLSYGQRGTLDGGASEGPVRHLYLYVESELYARVEKAVTAAGAKIVPWLRAMVRQITLTDFPPSWQEATAGKRSHDSQIYDTRFMLRLDKSAQTKLQHLISHFGASKADIIRQLLVQATPEDFPNSWQKRAAERPVPPIRQQATDNREVTQ